jgi:hypothetical protein
LHYRHDRLLEVLHSYVMKMKGKLNTYYLALILNAYAMLAPNNAKLLSDLGPELHDKLMAAVSVERRDTTSRLEDLVPDITAYCNLWLAITCFGVKASPLTESGEDAPNDEEELK